MLVSASEDTTLKLWSLDGNLIRTFEGHRDRVNYVNLPLRLEKGALRCSG